LLAVFAPTLARLKQGIGTKRLHQPNEQFSLPHPQIDGDAVSARQLNTKGYPTSILLDQSGRKVLNS
jgi:hypothetical protein